MRRRLLIVSAIVLLALGGYGVYSAIGSSGPVVPNVVADGDLARSYSVLRGLHLRVQVVFIDSPTLNVSSESPATVEHMWPAPGTHVKRGDVVTLVADAQGVAQSIGVERNPPHFRVPDFVGRPAAAAVRWAGARSVYWNIPKLPSLVGNPAERLYDAYRVTAQEPKPGTVIGRWHRTHGGVDHTWLRLTVVVRGRTG